MLNSSIQICFPLGVIFLLCSQVIIAHSPLSNIKDLLFDENDHLGQNYLLYPNDPNCNNMIQSAWATGSFKLREVKPVVGYLFDLFFGEKNNSTECPAVCLDQGSKKSLLHFVIPEKYFGFEGVTAVTSQSLQVWMTNCQRAEIGFINWTPRVLNIYWLDSNGEKQHVGELGRKEENSVWRDTFLGHHFDVIDLSGTLVASFVVEYSGINVLGDAGTKVNPSWNVTTEIQRTMSHEWSRAHRVKRTFTKLGFKKGRMPNDLWNSIQSYYYNNRQNKVREEWEIDSKGLYVNWWEKDVYMISVPWGLKKYWQRRIMKLVEAWVGIKLELTDIYGMRQYEEGARLLTHVDREETHAASMIINIAQSSIREPWPLQIYDFANRLHEIVMDEGDIVYYESARCLHGRMKPLKGEFYVNMFAHYRPPGDSNWFLKPNPFGNVQPLVAPAQPCVKRNGNLTICSAGYELPYISQNLEQLKGPESLFKYWLEITKTEAQLISHKCNETACNRKNLPTEADSQAHVEL